MSRRRQVLQLEDVSSSHPAKAAGFQIPQTTDKAEKVNPLLSLVGQYNSDSSSEEDDSADGYVNGSQHKDENHPKSDNDVTPIETLSDTGMPLPADPPSKEPVVSLPKLPNKSCLPAPESLSKLSVPDPRLAGVRSQNATNADGINNSIDSEVANFLAEIESISAETVGQVEDINTASPKTASSMPSALSPTPAYGFIPKANAAVSVSQEEDLRLKAAPISGASSSAAAAKPYTAMFVKGALEFAGKDKEGEGLVESGSAQDEDLPEEPLCDWQMVQDDNTQYYYYWNIRTNEVTWEIPPSYTQFLLLYKEYEERLACIPLEKQVQIKEKKRLELEERREPSPAPSSSDPHSSASRRQKHRKDKSQREGLPDVPVGPLLPQELPETPVISSGQAESSICSDFSPLPEPAAAAAACMKVAGGEEMLASSEFAVDSTSMAVSADIEAIFDEALSAIAAHSSDKRKEASPSMENFSENTLVVESSAAVTSSKSKKLKKQEKDDKRSRDGDEKDLKKLKDRDTNEDKKSIDRDRREDKKLKNKDIRADKKSKDKTKRDDKKSRDRDDREDKRSKEDKGDKKSRDRDNKGDKKPRARDDREDKKPRDREDKKPRDRDEREDRKLRSKDDREIKKTRDKDDKEDKRSRVSQEEKKPKDKNDREDKKKKDKETKSKKETDSLKPSSSVELCNLARAPSVEKGVDTAQSTITTTSIVTTTDFTVATQKNAVVTSSSSSSTVTSVEGELFNSNDAVVSNSGMKDETGEDEEFDVDFDDIDDVDRALEKALEKKLEKKKAELERLQREDTEDVEFDRCPQASSSPRSPTATAQDIYQKNAFSAPDTAVSSSVRSTTPSALSSLKVSDNPAFELEMSDMHVGSSKCKRLAVAAPSHGMERHAQLEPVTKKARLVAYDAAETDEDSLDTSDEVSTSCIKPTLPSNDDSALKSESTLSTEKVLKLAEIQDMADTALAKLTFLDVTSEGLSSLQLTLIQLQTRLLDWKEGGLNSEYFYQRLREVNAVLRQYESSAVPSGWTCQWDSNFRRYFYANACTGQAQWDYPDGDASAVAASASTLTHATATTMLAVSPDRASGTLLTKAKKKRVKAVPGAEQHFSARGEIKPSGDGEMETEQISTYWNIQENLVGDISAGADPSHRYETSKVYTAKPSSEEVTISTTSTISVPGTPLNTPFVASTEPGTSGVFQTLFPGEPLPPGTEFLLGLPPPPPPPLPPPPPDETHSTTNDVYACGDDSSEGEAAETMAVAVSAMYDPDIDGEEMRDETDVRHRWVDSEVDGVPLEVEEAPPVISRPPQLHAPVIMSTSAQALPSVSSAHVPTVPYASHVYEAMSSSVSISKPAMLSAAPMLNVTGLASHVPDNVSSAASALHAAATMASSVHAAAIVASSVHVSASSVAAPSLYSTSNPGSPKEDKTRRAGSPTPCSDVPSSSTGDQHKIDKHEKHKKKKEKLGSHTMSLKKKGVASMVQKWQKVKKEVEREERASEQRQMAIRQQLEEWKKENS